MLRHTKILFILIVALFPALSAASETVKIGVLAKRGYEATIAKWSETANYLTERLPSHKFTIVPLGFSEIDPAIKNKSVDFILVNSGIYIHLEHNLGVSRIVTLQNKANDQVLSKFGGVIFTRKERHDINSLDDIVHKRFSAVDETSLGGFQMAWLEFHKNNIDPYADFSELVFKGTHDNVVYSVLDSEADVGTVRTDTLERMEKEGKISLDSIKIIRSRHFSGDDSFPLLYSTELHPEWPFSKLLHTPEQLSKDVAIALIEMNPTSRAAVAAKTAGWTIPANYQSVHTLFHELRLPPYEEKPITFWVFLVKYAYVIGLSVVGFIATFVWLLYTLKINANLKLTTIELKDAQKIIETEKQYAIRANEAKSVFLSNMTHELRTPINGISGFVYLMEKNLHKISTEPEKILNYLDKIKISTNNMTVLVDNLLELSRLEIGDLNPKFEKFDLDKILKTVLKKHENLINDKNITITLEKYNPVNCEIDSYLITLVIDHLLLNAITYSPEHSVIKVGTSSSYKVFSGDQQEIIEFSITDDGVGIPQDELEHIFDKFTQSSKTKTGAGGTGLGLSICREAIALHSGRIYAESPINRGGTGSKFTIVIPRHQYSAAQFKFENLESAIKAHQEWMAIIDEAFTTHTVPTWISVNTLSNDKKCLLGQWLEQQEDSESLRTLEQLHKDFHHSASECVVYCQEKEMNVAKTKYDNALDLSEKLVSVIRSLPKEKFKFSED